MANLEFPQKFILFKILWQNFKNDDKNFKHSHEQERLLKGDT